MFLRRASASLSLSAQLSQPPGPGPFLLSPGFSLFCQGLAAGAEVKRDPHLDLPDLLLAVPGSATLHPVPSVRGPQDLGLVPWTLPSVGSVIPFSGWRLGTWGVLQVTISSAWTPGFHWHLTSLTLTSWPQKVPRYSYIPS